MSTPSSLDPWRLYEGAESDEPEDPRELTTGRIPDPQPAHTPLYAWLAALLIKIESTLRARGGATLRRIIFGFWAFIGTAGIVLIVGPIINKPLSFDDVIDSAKLSAVDWIMTDGVFRYDIDRDESGGITAHVTETFVASVRGDGAAEIERLLPTHYEGHSLQLEISAATIDGEPAQISRDDEITYATVNLTPMSGETLTARHQIELRYTLHNIATVETDSVTGEVIDEVNWNVFAVDLLQGARGVTVEVTLPNELDTAMLRPPRGSVAWLLVGDSAWLEPDEEISGTGPGSGLVGYSFNNDQGLPPHTQARLTLAFEQGTFVMPPYTTLFWVQTFGPVVPLALLVVLLLFALAARKVAWADVHGRPWFVMQSKPPAGVSPAFAAQLLRKPLPQKLGATLAERPKHPSERWVQFAARIASRTGRIGDIPRAIYRYVFSLERVRAHTEGLRRRPVGYVRDAFVWAPIALTLVQWGLLRQLSERTVLAVVWWPAAFFWLSLLISVVVVYIALAADPLTHKGALVVQHLKGLGLFTEQTQVLGRGPLSDSLLPYAVLFGSSREAGKSVVELAQRETGDRDVARGWNSPENLHASAVAAGVAALALFVGAIVTVASQPYPYEHRYETVVFDGDLPGTLKTSIDEFHASAHLSRDGEGRAVLSVRENLTVHFESGSELPQLGREWPNLRLGQTLGVQVDDVRIDGKSVAWREVPRPRSMGVVTELQTLLEGEHEAQVDYTLTSAAVAARQDGVWVDQVRWAALYEYWERELLWIDHELRGVGIELTIDAELVDEIIEGGWLTNDFDAPDLLWEYGNGLAPWNYAESLEEYMAPKTQLGHQRTLPDGSLHVVIDLQESWVGGWAYELTSFSDLGARLDFTEGTFTGTEPGQARAEVILQELPALIVVVITIMLIIGGAWLTFVGRVRKDRKANLTLRAFSYFVLPVAGLGQFVLFYWATSEMPTTHDRFPLMGWLTVASISLGIVQLWSVIAPPPGMRAEKQRAS